jgi:metallophosphoesterase (TIGR00282 family)
LRDDEYAACGLAAGVLTYNGHAASGKTLSMRILFIGDIVGPPGIEMVRRAVPWLIQREGLDCVIANAENAHNGTGLTASIYKKLRASGVDLVTLGDHIYKKAEIATTLNEEERICKPANFPPEAAGRDFAFGVTRGGVPVAVVSLLGRTFMRPVDCPFRAIDRVLPQLEGKARVVFVDVHAEATADKYLLGHHLKGRVSAVLGTHTHVQTADEHVMPGGTAFLCDAGMTGPYESILGRRIDRVLSTTITFMPSPFDVATGDPRLAGAIVDVDPETGRATGIRRVMVTEAMVGQIATDEHR